MWRSEETIGETYYTTLNGLLHSFDDKPAEVTKEKMMWFKNGRLHRDNGKAAVVLKTSQNEWKDASWFVEGCVKRMIVV